MQTTSKLRRTSMPWRRILFVACVSGISAISLTVPAAFTLNPWKWATTSAGYYVNPQTPDVSATAALAAVQAGASAWHLQSNAGFRFQYLGTTSNTVVSSNGRNEVFFRNASNGSAAATTYVWSTSGRITEADIVFWDGPYRFFTGTSGCVSGIFVEDVATHEFGHALGLSHSSISTATMAPTIRYCSQDLRSLDLDDKLGVELLYPLSSLNTAPVVTITSPITASTFAQGALVPFSGTAIDTQDGVLSSSLQWASSRDGAIGVGASFAKALSVGTHTITASVADRQGVRSQAAVSVSVISSTSSIGTAVLSGTSYRKHRWAYAVLSWRGLASSSVDVYRDGRLVVSTENDGSYSLRAPSTTTVSNTFKVCARGTTVCSNTVTVVY